MTRGLVLAMLLAAIGLPAFCLADTRLNVPLVEADHPVLRDALDRIVPADPAELLTTQVLLEKLNYPEEAQAVADVMERSTLLKLLGQRPRSGDSLQQAMDSVRLAQPSIETLRARVLSSVRLEMRNGPIGPLVDLDQQEKTAARPFPLEGGEWTRGVFGRSAYLFLPVKVEYLGQVGFVKGLEAKLTVTPAGARQPLEFTVAYGFNRQELARLHAKRGEAFWLLASSARNSPRVDEMLATLRSLEPGTYRLESQVTALWMSLSEDPRQPFMEVAPDRTLSWSDPNHFIPRPDIPESTWDISERACVEQAAARLAEWNARHSAAALTEADAAGMRRPLIKDALTRLSTQSSTSELLEAHELLAAAGQPAAAQTLGAFIERSELLALLEQHPDSHEPILDVIARGAPAVEELQPLRTCILRDAIRVQLPAASPDEVAKELGFDARYTHEGSGVWSFALDGQPYLTLPVVVINTANRGFFQVEFDLQLAATGSADALAVRVSRTGGSVLRPGEAALLQALIPAGERGRTAASLIQMLAGMPRLQHTLPSEVRQIEFAPSGSGAAFEVAPDRAQWRNLDPLQARVRAKINAASCAEKNNCISPRSGEGLSNPLVWVTVQTILSFIPLVLVPRRRSANPSFRLVYGVYWLLVLCAAVLAFADRPGSGWQGIVSVGSGMVSGLPWTLLIDAKGAFGTFYRGGDADLVFVWACIAINQILLGLFAFRPKSTAPAARL